MFCPSCGTEYTIELNYCKRCGANLSSALTTQPETASVNLTKPTLVIGATLAVFNLGGFVALMAGVVGLASVVHGDDPLIALIFFGMIIMLTVDIFLVRQLSKLISALLKSDSPKNIKNIRKTAAPLPVVTQLPPLSSAQPSPAPSVTENTTRLFEPAYSEPPKSEAPPARPGNSSNRV